MKAVISVLLIIVGLSSCEKKETPKPAPAPAPAAPNYPSYNHVQLLKVDYLTYDFEGGADVWLSSIIPGAQTMPIKVTYKEPGDFGSVLLQIETTGDSLFSGTIIWMGTGEIDFPETFAPDSAFAVTFGANQLIASDFVPISLSPGHQPPQPDPTKTSNAISKLKIVSDHKALGKKLQVLLYTPSVGIGDPAQWDWIFLLAL